MSKKKQFYVQGIYHPVLVKIVSKKWLSRYVKDKDILGIYEHDQAKIYLVRELSPQVKLHTLYHELSHHIISTLEGIEEEQKCDLLGTFLMKVSEDREKVQRGLSDETKEKS